MFLIINEKEKIYDKYIFEIQDIINQNEFIDFDLLKKLYLHYNENDIIDIELYEDIKTAICDRIIYQLIKYNKDICISIKYICDSLLHNFYSKVNPDRFDLRLKCFTEQFYIQYTYFNNNMIDYISGLHLCNINIIQSFNVFNQNIITDIYIKNDIVILFNHFFENIEKYIIKMDVIQLSNYIGKFFYYIICVDNLSQLYIISYSCHCLFNKIDSLTQQELYNYIIQCDNDNIINYNSFIFYYYYAKLKYDLYTNNNIITIIEHLNDISIDNPNYYYNYLNNYEKKTAIFHCIYTILFIIKYSLNSCMKLIHYYEYVEKHSIPHYIYKIAKYYYKQKMNYKL